MLRTAAIIPNFADQEPDKEAIKISTTSNSKFTSLNRKT